MKGRLPYSEGDWFVVPLSRGGFAAGIVARSDKHGEILGYFFGPRRPVPPSLSDLKDKHPAHAVLICRFSDLELARKRWPILGRFPDWDRSQWPVPPFCHHDPVTGTYWRREYADDDPGHLLRQVRVTAEECARLPGDGLYGARAVEIVLDRVLVPVPDADLGLTHRDLPGNSQAQRPDSSIAAPASGTMATDAQSGEQAVLVYLRLSNDAFGDYGDQRRIHELDDQLDDLLTQSGAGEFDGNEVGLGYWELFLHGSSADLVFDLVRPILSRFPAKAGSYVVKRYGEPGAPEERVTLWERDGGLPTEGDRSGQAQPDGEG